jgi:alpha/beta superfamily hydrolase
VHAEVVVGDRDELVSVAEARDLARGLGARLHVIDDADHFFVGQRMLVARTLRAFLSAQQSAPP